MINKKMSLLLLVFSSLVYSNDFEQDIDYPVSTWRCGAPLVEQLRLTDPHLRLNDPNGQLYLKESLKEISKSNVSKIREDLGELTTNEKKLLSLINSRFTPPIVHRTNMHVVKMMYRNNQNIVSPTKRSGYSKVTPSVEQKLFSGWDCIFASVSPPVGIKQYGDVVLKIKNNTKFAWGSIHTGYSWIKEVLNRSIRLPVTSDMKRKFSNQIFTNNHFNLAIAYQIISNIRNDTSLRSRGAPYAKDSILTELLSQVSSEDFWTLVSRHRLGYLEAHYTDNLELKDLEYVGVQTKYQRRVNSWIERSNTNNDEKMRTIKFY